MTLFLIVTSNVLGFVLSLENVGQTVSSVILGLTENKLVIIAIMSTIFIILGMFLEAPPMIFAFLPSFLPILQEAEVDLLHWAFFSSSIWASE
jgi:TRAP-type C4-dicarboxylate transport system permease large subunit